MCRKALADGRDVGMLRMDLSKAYDCIPHDLLIAKLAAYGLPHYSLLLIHNYFSNRKQRVKVGPSFTSDKSSSQGFLKGQFLALYYSIFS